MPSLPRLPFLIPLVLGVSLAGCSTNLKDYTGLASPRALLGATRTPLDALAARYDARPGEKQASLAYAEALRAERQLPQAVAVLQRTSIENVGDRDVASAYGKALADIGRFEEALKVLSQALKDDRPDWQVLSAMGSVNDQMGNHTRARELYARALQIRPNQPVILNNLGLSYILTRDLARAEDTLRLASEQPGADARINANLALARSLRTTGAREADKATAPKRG